MAATVADFSDWLVKTTDLTELEVVDIQEGQRASVVLDAIPDVTLNGVVEAISQTYAEKQGDVVIRGHHQIDRYTSCHFVGYDSIRKFCRASGLGREASYGHSIFRNKKRNHISWRNPDHPAA